MNVDAGGRNGHIFHIKQMIILDLDVYLSYT